MQPLGGQYIGNADYRGYLNYLGSKGDQTAKSLITGTSYAPMGVVDNNGNLAGKGIGLLGSTQSANQQYQAQYQQLVNQGIGPSSFGGGASYATPPPNWDLPSIYNQAGSQAAGQVNPYYSKQLLDFQNNQARTKALQQQQRDLSLQNLQADLTNTLQGNDISRGRTSQDVLTNEQNIGQQAQYRQEDQGVQFDQARIAQAKQLAESGLTGSGLGNQQALESQTTRNTQEARQGAQDIQDVAHQELLKARSFEDLARSDVLSKQSEAQGEKQSQIDWDKFVQGQQSDYSQYTNSLEQQRLGRLGEVQRQLAKQQVNNMIHNLSNPQQRLAAASAYGGAF